MTSEDSEARGHEAAFPSEMQGRWIEDGEPTFEVVVSGAEIFWRGVAMDYLAKRIAAHEDGVVSVELEFADQTDSGDSINLIAGPEGDMYAFSDHFASRFVRSNP